MMSVRYKKNQNSQQRPGSTTKLMCAMVVLDWVDDADLDDVVTVISADTVDWGTNSNAGLKTNDVLSTRDLLFGLLLVSGNDAGKCLARTVGGLMPGAGTATAKFIAAMNAKASSLGMTQTVFTDSYGVDSGNLMTARDLATLMRAFGQYPYLREVSATPSHVATITGPDARTPTWVNHINPDGTVKLPELICGKVGNVTYANPALNSGFCLAALWALPNGQERVTAILGSATNLDRFRDLRRLMDYEIARSSAT